MQVHYMANRTSHRSHTDDLLSLTALKDYVAAHWPKTPGRAYDALQ